MMKNLMGPLAAVAVLAFLVVVSSALYVVDETEQVVITRFGKPTNEPIQEAGLKVKMPFVDKINTFEKRILQWDGDPNRIPTKDKKYIFVDTFARWRITDPLIFYQSLRNEHSAHSRLDDIIDGATRNVIASMDLIEMVRSSTRTFEVSELGMAVFDKEARKPISNGRDKIVGMILALAIPKLEGYGIAVEDVQIKRINYVEKVSMTVYDRMISERMRAAEQFRSEGQGEKAKLEGRIEKDLLKIQSEAQRTAQEIRGKADREALGILSRAYNRDPSFFAFYQTLQTYEESLKKDSKLILSTDNDYIRYLKKISR